MMLVSSSGWAHSPITLILTGSTPSSLPSAVLAAHVTTNVARASADRATPKCLTAGRPLECRQQQMYVNPAPGARDPARTNSITRDPGGPDDRNAPTLAKPGGGVELDPSGGVR